MEKRYTITQSVRDTLAELPHDIDFKGYDFLAKCRTKLRKNGSLAKPFDATLLREMRSLRHLYGITLVDRSKSIYHKGKKTVWNTDLQ